MGGRKVAKSGQKPDEEPVQHPNGGGNSKDVAESDQPTAAAASFADMDSLLPARWRLWWLPIALTFLCYAPNLIIYANDQQTWVYDDHSSVRSNPCVTGVDQMKKPVPWTCAFWADYWGTPMSSNMSHKSYRPVTTIFFIAERTLWGFADSRLWHLGNVATKAAAVWLFARVAKLCLTCQESADFATLLFAVHPIHTESVSNITGQAESLSAVFMLLAFLAYARRTGSTLISSGMAVLAALAATLSKEAGFSALAIICVHIVSAELRAVKSAIVKKEQQQEKSNRQYLGWRDLRLVRPAVWLKLAGYILAGAVIFIGRCCIQQEQPQFNSFMNPGGFHSSRLARALTMAHYGLVHARLLLLPATLCPDYSNAAIPELESLLDQRCLPIYLVAIGLVWCAFALLRAALDKRRDVHELVTCAAWLVLPFLPVSNLFFVVGFAVAERILFAPSIGFCLLVGFGVRKLTEVINQIVTDQTRHRIIDGVHRCARWLLVLLAIRTCLRDLDWNTSRSLWYSAYKSCPPNANVLANLAISEPENPGFQYFLFDRATAIGKPFSMDHSVGALARLMESAGQHREMLELCKKHNQGGSPKIAQCIAYGLLELRKPAQAVREFQGLYSRLNESHWHLSQVEPSDVIRGYARSLALVGRADKAIQIIRQHEPDVSEPVKQHMAVSEVLAVALSPRLNDSQPANDEEASFEVALSRLTSRSPSPEALMDLAKELCQAGCYREALAALDSVQPIEARQSPMAIYLRRLAQDGLYSKTQQCQQRENQLLKNLTGLGPLGTLSALTGIADRVAETDLADSSYSLFHACRLIVQPIDTMLYRLDAVAKGNPPLSSLVAIRKLFLGKQRGELFLHSQMMTERQRLDAFLSDMRQAVRQLEEMRDIEEDLQGWALKPAEMYQLVEETDED